MFNVRVRVDGMVIRVGVRVRVRHTGAACARTDPGPVRKPWRGYGRHDTCDDQTRANPTFAYP